ncbi:MAG TPA: methyltransferase domain-containing protein [Thermohalobaculum sp.]|nr:methyltransferase domain-containing protein [Thermohalobaculum sp.]
MATREEWIAASGAEWAAHVAATDAALGPFGQEACTRLALRAGERVLDVGCGAGASTLMLARDVGEEGRVTAIDVSPPLVRLARERVEGHANIEIVEADAAEHDFGGTPFDALFSRFGCTFFGDPASAWATLHRALRTDGRVSVVVWRTLEENDWARVPLEAAAEVFGDTGPTLAAAPEGVGPFAWADPKVFEPLLEGAGFREVVREKLDLRVPYGTGTAKGSLDRAVHMMLHVGPLARRIRNTDEAEREGVQKQVEKRLKRLLRPYDDDDAVRMTGRAWLITARA